MCIRDRRVAVGVDEACGQLVLAEPSHFAEDVLGGLDVEVLVDPRAEDVASPEDLEEVELEVADIEMCIRDRSRTGGRSAGPRWTRVTFVAMGSNPLWS